MTKRAHRTSESHNKSELTQSLLLSVIKLSEMNMEIWAAVVKEVESGEKRQMDTMEEDGPPHHTTVQQLTHFIGTLLIELNGLNMKLHTYKNNIPICDVREREKGKVKTSGKGVELRKSHCNFWTLFPHRPLLLLSTPSSWERITRKIGILAFFSASIDWTRLSHDSPLVTTDFPLLLLPLQRWCCCCWLIMSRNRWMANLTMEAEAVENVRWKKKRRGKSITTNCY